MKLGLVILSLFLSVTSFAQQQAILCGNVTKIESARLLTQGHHDFIVHLKSENRVAKLFMNARTPEDLSKVYAFMQARDTQTRICITHR